MSLQCNKCGKRRGPLGDAVVKAYIDTIKIARDMGPGSGLAPHLVREQFLTHRNFEIVILRHPIELESVKLSYIGAV